MERRERETERKLEGGEREREGRAEERERGGIESNAIIIPYRPS